MDALFIVDVLESTANKGSLVQAISEYIEYRVDELDMISFDKQTDLSLHYELFGRSAVIIDDQVLFNFDGFPIFDSFQETIKGSNTFQIKSQLELAVNSVFPLINATTELVVYYLSDKFPIYGNETDLPCDTNNDPLINPLRGEYFFISLNNNLIGAQQYLSNCLNQDPNHEQYTFLNDFTTQRIGGVKVTTIEGEGTEDTLYAHVCGIGMFFLVFIYL